MLVFCLQNRLFQKNKVNLIKLNLQRVVMDLFFSFFFLKKAMNNVAKQSSSSPKTMANPFPQTLKDQKQKNKK